MNSKDELYYSAIDLLHRLIRTPSISREEDAAAQIICETLQKTDSHHIEPAITYGLSPANSIQKTYRSPQLAHRYGKAHRQLESPALCSDRRR